MRLYGGRVEPEVWNGRSCGIGAGPSCQLVSGLNADRCGALKHARSVLIIQTCTSEPGSQWAKVPH